MDRTAWFAITLCILGIVAWELWVSRQTLHSPAGGVSPSPGGPSPGGSPVVSATASVASPVPQPTTIAIPSATPAQFAEQMETLRNSDLELHLTNRGGGIAEAVLPNYPAEQDRRVTLNSPAKIPIGA